MVLGYFNGTQLRHSSFVNAETGEINPTFFVDSGFIFETSSIVERTMYLCFGSNSIASCFSIRPKQTPHWFYLDLLTEPLNLYT